MFINGERSIGKTYGIQMHLIKRALEKQEEFIYIVRTIKDKDNKAFEKAFEKMLFQQHPDLDYKFTNDTITINDKVMGYCLALSDTQEIKKRSFPRVFWMYMDEYVYEKKFSHKYVTGWNEPNLLLNIYHTVDREEDRVKCLLTGNTLEFYNPYHIHKAFKIPFTKADEIWYSENVLFQHAIGTAELKEAKKASKFLRMIDDTNYGRAAKDSVYEDETPVFIEKRPPTSQYVCTMEFDGDKYGVWRSNYKGTIYFSNTVDSSCLFSYAISVDDHNENTILAKNSSIIKWLVSQYKMSNVKFEDAVIKSKAIQIITRCMS